MRPSMSLWALALLGCLSLAVAKEQVTHVKTYLSDPFELASGDVIDNYHKLEFPQGHIGMRNFFAEVVDEDGNSVPLYDVYLHHWVVVRLYVKKGFGQLLSPKPKEIVDPNVVSSTHQGHLHRMQFQEGADVLRETRQGTCLDDQDTRFFGVGSETRHTETTLPAPYAMEVGDPEKVPEGYEEVWYLNIHAIDTRGAVDSTKCLECFCTSYGVTKTSSGAPLPEGYVGGMRCCYDGTHCAVNKEEALPPKKMFLRYTVTWVDMDETVVPVRTYFLDASDPRTSLEEKPSCKIEYNVPACTKGPLSGACVDRRVSIGALPEGGDLIQGTLHQHAGGMGGILYDKDGIVLCQSLPIYGKGHVAGDEAGYVVGMTTCYPELGSTYIESWKELHFEAFYSNKQAHTGVMSAFTLHVADPITFIEKVTN